MDGLTSAAKQGLDPSVLHLTLTSHVKKKQKKTLFKVKRPGFEGSKIGRDNILINKKSHYNYDAISHLNIVTNSDGL